MKLIDDWKTAHRFWSVRLGVLGAAVMAVVTIWPDGIILLWNMMPEQVQVLLPERLVSVVGVVLYILTVASRLVHQPKLHGGTRGKRKG